ncbi:YtxH domain-containing protein [Staphylococcus sp. SQ8-PEA]|uniref:YtxH domain-containing protein n=1 Tax=Staphylococcus marylandisciuri TaxID=2981529 RepID=A0ABT2QQH2_9STAP|nr:YtxH domain-containing protein [Staphylococcus marylandisciuri]MCU5746224.1 YtxH domain-containing protein [Staphylococcus marylandisciuri]
MKNKLVPGILVGAVVGGLATLADKSTRQSVQQSFKDLKEGKRSSQPSVFTTIKDEVLYWKDTLEEIRRKNPDLEKQLKNAKDTLIDRKNNRLN